MRPALILLSLLTVLVSSILLLPWQSHAAAASTWQSRRALVEAYGLTDLALFCEARYTRHPSQADLHSAFQDHPGAFEHFPSGTMLPPPSSLRKRHASLAGKTAASD